MNRHQPQGDRTLRIALLGNPNCGKTALFNLLTGSRQKVANYAGVTVERKAGHFRTPGGRLVEVLDLPGAYSLHAISADEAVTRDIVTGRVSGEARPDVLVCVVDATKLRLNLRLVLEARSLGLPMVLALNMSDQAARKGLVIDREALSRELGMPVVETVGVRQHGADALLAWLDGFDASTPVAATAPPVAPLGSPDDEIARVTSTQQEVRRIVARCVHEGSSALATDDVIDRWVLHPVWGMVLLLALLFLMFQAVFSWAAVPMDAIKSGVEGLGRLVEALMPEGVLRSLLVDGVIAGAGSVLVFLPQILILFLFILALEDSGYLPRAAFLLDRPMAAVGLSGRSFIPLLSSFACAVPGIMSTRSIAHWRDRLVTIMVAPLMTCSARLPVYALLIGAFVPQRSVGGVFNLQGLVLFVLYAGGVLSAMAVAWVMRRFRTSTKPSLLLMELPAYRWPTARNVLLGLLTRAKIFLTDVGGIILALMVLLWALSSFPAPPDGATGPAIRYSVAGQIGSALAYVFEPIGFDWQIAIALVLGMAAREVAVGALGTVYALSATDAGVATELGAVIAQSWSLATALSLLVWYVFAPQCISTLVTVRRETGSWHYPLLMAGYLFAMAYLASFVTYRVALGWGG